MTTARNPAGPWDPLACVMKASGWDDCCPFWDDDGQGYLVGTRFAADSGNGKRYNIHLFKLASDGKTLISGFDKILYQSQGSEANKLYKWNGLYYHFFSEVHREGRVTMIRRTATLTGPAEIHQLNHVNKAADREPNQGGIVQTATGDWWFVTHQGAGAWEEPHALPAARYVRRRLADHRPTRRRRHRQHGLAGEETARGPARDPAANVRHLRWPDPGTTVGMELPAEGRKVVADGPPRLAASAGIPPFGTGKSAQGRQHAHAKDFRHRRRSDRETGRCHMADGQAAGLCHYSGKYAWIGVTQSGGASGSRIATTASSRPVLPSKARSSGSDRSSAARAQRRGPTASTAATSPPSAGDSALPGPIIAATASASSLTTTMPTPVSWTLTSFSTRSRDPSSRIINDPLRNDLQLARAVADAFRGRPCDPTARDRDWSWGSCRGP